MLHCVCASHCQITMNEQFIFLHLWNSYFSTVMNCCIFSVLGHIFYNRGPIKGHYSKLLQTNTSWPLICFPSASCREFNDVLLPNSGSKTWQLPSPSNVDLPLSWCVTHLMFNDHAIVKNQHSTSCNRTSVLNSEVGCKVAAKCNNSGCVTDHIDSSANSVWANWTGVFTLKVFVKAFSDDFTSFQF